MGMVRDGIKPVADAIGITPEQLLTELRSGKSIADVAKAHSVSEAKVVAAIEAEANKRIDDAVAKGRLTSDQAAKIKAKLHDGIVKMVEHAGGAMPFGGRRRGDAGHGSSTKSPPTTGPATKPPPSTSAPTTRAPATSAPATTVAPSTTEATTTEPPTTN